MMNKDVSQGKLKQLRDAVKQRWGALTDKDLDMVDGKPDQLPGLLFAQSFLEFLLTFLVMSLVSKIVFLFHFAKLFFVSTGQIIPLTDSFLKSLLSRNRSCIKVCQNCKIIAYNITLD